MGSPFGALEFCLSAQDMLKAAWTTTIPIMRATLPLMKASAYAVRAQVALFCVRRRELRRYNARRRFGRLADRALYRRRSQLDGRWLLQTSPWRGISNMERVVLAQHHRHRPRH